MDDRPPIDTTDRRAFAGARRFARPLLYGLGAGLIVAAIMAAQQVDGPALWPIVRGASAWQLVVLLLFPIGNWLLTSALFSTLTGQFGRVGRGEMAALIGASWLLNYLPLQPGLLGRIAYHRRYNAISVRHSLVVIACSMGCTLGAATMMVGAVVVANQLGRAREMIAVLAVIGGAVFVGGVAWRLIAPAAFGGRLVLALGLRYADMGLAAIRYTVLFEMLGNPIRDSEGTLLAATSLVATLPPVPMGLREWAVELLSRNAAMAPVAAGLRVDLMGRCGEVAVAGAVGVISMLWLYRRQRRTGVIAADNGN